MNINVKVDGLEKVLMDFSKRGLDAQERADHVTETYTLKMAMESADMAPVDKGDLRASILASPEQLDDALWQYGSDLSYARKQEYENISNKGFIRKAVWNNRSPYREALRREVLKK